MVALIQQLSLVVVFLLVSEVVLGTEELATSEQHPQHGRSLLHMEGGQQNEGGQPAKRFAAALGADGVAKQSGEVVEFQNHAPNNNSIIILDSTNYYTSNFATELGFTVVVANDSAWYSMSTEDFMTYRAIILGDPHCVFNPSPLETAEATVEIWGPAVTSSNIIILGTDQDYHSYLPGGERLAANAISFAANVTGKTGLMVSLSCYYSNNPLPTFVPVLSYFGDFYVAQAGTCFNDVHIVAHHPTLNSLSDQYLSNWDCSVHEIFTSIDTSRSGIEIHNLAIANKQNLTGAIQFADGSYGTPYIVASGVAPISITSSPPPPPMAPPSPGIFPIPVSPRSPPRRGPPPTPTSGVRSPPPRSPPPTRRSPPPTRRSPPPTLRRSPPPRSPPPRSPRLPRSPPPRSPRPPRSPPPRSPRPPRSPPPRSPHPPPRSPAPRSPRPALRRSPAPRPKRSPPPRMPPRRRPPPPRNSPRRSPPIRPRSPPVRRSPPRPRYVPCTITSHGVKGLADCGQNIRFIAYNATMWTTGGRTLYSYNVGLSGPPRGTMEGYFYAKVPPHSKLLGHRCSFIAGDNKSRACRLCTDADNRDKIIVTFPTVIQAASKYPSRYAIQIRFMLEGRARIFDAVMKSLCHPQTVKFPPSKVVHGPIP